MKRRHYRDDLSAFNPRHGTPSGTSAHHGLCACGVETTRMGYSSAEPWVCSECAEKALRATYDRAMQSHDLTPGWHERYVRNGKP